DVPRPVDSVEHRLVRQSAQGDRARRRRRADARPVRDPDRHGPRQDAHDRAPHRDHGGHGEPAVRAADALGARARAARPRVQVRARRGCRRRAGRVRRPDITVAPEPLVVVPDDFPSVFEGTPAHERLKKLGETRVYTARGAEDEAELIRRIGGARIIVNIRAHARFTDAVFAACRDIELVSIWGTGTDNVDLDAAGRRGVTVCNTPGVNAFAVAEHTLALMLAAARKIPKTDHEMRGGAWPRVRPHEADDDPGQHGPGRARRAGRAPRRPHPRQARGRGPRRLPRRAAQTWRSAAGAPERRALAPQRGPDARGDPRRAAARR